MELPGTGEIDLWCWSLAVATDRLAALEATLSHDERHRRDRFYFARDANRFVAARGQLRAILAGYLRLDADAVCFGYNECGKPYLKRHRAEPPICFNLTHSDGLAALAVATDCEVGIDIERIRTTAEDMASLVMTDAEQHRLRWIAPELRMDAFFRCWTRKEAVLKAIGDGLSLPPRSLEVSFAADECARLLHIGGDRLATHIWQVEDFIPAPGYAGAIAARKRPWSLRARQLSCLIPTARINDPWSALPRRHGRDKPGHDGEGAATSVSSNGGWYKFR